MNEQSNSVASTSFSVSEPSKAPYIQRKEEKKILGLGGDDAFLPFPRLPAEYVYYLLKVLVFMSSRECLRTV